MDNYVAGIACTPLFAPASQTDVESLQGHLGRALPGDYVEFLRTTNGVRFSGDFRVAYATQPHDDHSLEPPSWTEWVPGELRTSRDGIGDIRLLYGVSGRESLSLLSEQNGYRFDTWAPPRFVAIGEPIFEIGRICMSLEGDDRGAIYFWLHPEDYPNPGENCPNMDFMDWIAPSFASFCGSLREMTRDEFASYWPSTT